MSSVMMDRRGFLAGSFAFGACLMSRGAQQVLTAAEDAAKPLPHYYDVYLDGIAQKVNALAEKTADGFWFITDLHITANRRQSGKAIVALSRKIPSFNKTFCGGDLPVAFSSGFATPQAGVDAAVDFYRLCWVDPIESAGLKMYTAKGNHDFTIRKDATSMEGFTYPNLAAKKIIMGSKGCQAAVTNPADSEACYYYMDNPAAKVRYIIADTTDSIKPNATFWGVVSGMHETQLRWLAEQAIATIPADFGAVVIHHIPITGCVGDEGERNRYRLFRELLEAYQNRKSCVLFGKTYDFSTARGRIIMDLTGHHHAERETFQNGILYVTEPCDAAYGDYILGSKPWCGDLPRKLGGTVNEQTFDAVQLDPAHDRVYFTRVGGGQDRVIHLKTQTVAAGSTLKLSAPLLKGPLTWGCYDADRIVKTPNPKNRYNPIITYVYERAKIAPDGTLTALKPGEVMALAMDANLNKEIFPITVT